MIDMQVDGLEPPLVLALNPALDVPALAARFAASGHVRIRDVLLPVVAEDVRRRLEARSGWKQIINGGAQVFELDRAGRAAMPDDQRRALDAAVYRGARDGFQYRYEAIRLPDGNVAALPDEDPLAGIARWLSRGPARDVLRQITGRAGIAFADGQATAYDPGDFLTGHDDAVAGKNRLAAFVLGLTRPWRPEWGGLLLFHGADGSLAGETPGFNTLDLFAVPQRHSVSLVSPAAAGRRYAITGWLRQSESAAAATG